MTSLILSHCVYKLYHLLANLKKCLSGCMCIYVIIIENKNKLIMDIQSLLAVYVRKSVILCINVCHFRCCSEGVVCFSPFTWCIHDVCSDL